MSKWIFLVLFFNLIASVDAAESLVEIESTPKYSKDYFTFNIPQFKKHLSEYVGKDNIKYLELGVYEGRSLIWVAQNILTGASSSAVGVDTFPGELLDVFKKNISAVGIENKVEIKQGLFSDTLGKFPKQSFDIVYLDGGHMSWTTLETTMLAWPLLKPEGIMIFDDYRWNEKKWPEHFTPKLAIDSFIATHKNFIEVIHAGYQVFVRKKTTSCEALDSYACMPLNEWAYYLHKRILIHTITKTKFELKKSDHEELDKILASKKYSAAKDSVEIQIIAKKDKRLKSLISKITFAK